MYKIYNEKIEANEESNELRNQVNNLNRSVGDLQGKINTISEIINNTSNDSSNNNEEAKYKNDNSAKSFSDAEIKNALQNYLNLQSAYASSPETLLVELDLTEWGEFSDRQGDDLYIKTNIKYSDYKNAMLNYMTDKCFELNFTDNLKNVDGYLYFSDVGGSG